MAVDLGMVGQMCGLCNLPVGAPSGIVLPGGGAGGAVPTTCGGHTPDQALQIMFARVQQMEQYVHILMTEREAAIQAQQANEVTITVPEGMSDEDVDALVDQVGEQILDDIQRDDS